VDISRPSPAFVSDIDFQNGGLLYQFLLEEFIYSARMVEKAQASYQRLNEVEGLSSFDDSFEELADTVFGLISPGGHFPWSNAGASLSKLHEYSLLLCSSACEGPCPRVKLAKKVDHALGVTLSLQRSLASSSFSGSTSLSCLEQVGRHLSSLSKRMAETGRCLLRLLPEFRSDENVIYYVLRRENDLADIVGSPTVKRALNKLYPEKGCTAQNFVLERYAARGFEHVSEWMLQVQGQEGGKS
jgi:hypothetical protein